MWDDTNLLAFHHPDTRYITQMDLDHHAEGE